MATAMPRYRALPDTKNHSAFTFANLRYSTLASASLPQCPECLRCIDIIAGSGTAKPARAVVGHHIEYGLCTAVAAQSGQRRE